MTAIMLQGNSTGVYDAPGLTPGNTLLYGAVLASAANDLTATPYNSVPAGFALLSNQVNAASGWYVGTGQIIDPTASNWTGYSLIWIWQ
jgi:hypothetical protein